jgi:hypothetical protein
MSTIKVKWVVDELANVMSQFDEQKVYWASDEAGPYTEATAVGTRVPFTAGQALYYFDHLAGDPSYWYRVSYYNSSTTQESDPSDPFQASEAGGYATIEEVKAVLGASAPDDATIVSAIAQWSQFMDRACRQWFEPRYIDEKIDGSGARTLWLMAPIIGIDELYMNADWDNAVDPEWYEVYNNLGEGLRDDRRNPRIGLSDTAAGASIFTAISRRDVFIEGKKNQRVKGTFGFVEPDGSTPEMIKRATLKMVTKQLSASDPLNPSPGPAGPLVSETTDGHTIRYASMVGGRKIGTIGITGDAEVEGIIQLYRAPRAMAVVA